MSLRALMLLPMFALVACGGAAPAEKNLDSLDRELAEGIAVNAADPVLEGALQDQIMVDPQLAQKANNDAVRPPSQPYSAPIPSPDVAAAPEPPTGSVKTAPAPAKTCPQCDVRNDSLTLGALARRQTDARTSNCVGTMRYAAGWANRLPRDLPLYPGARVIEAAGSTAGRCAMRAVTFSTNQPIGTLVDWYYTQATNAGYSAEHQSDGDMHVIGGTRGKDGGAYVLFLTERDGGGTNVDLIANNGQ